MMAVLKHELRNDFHSFTAYVFGAFLLAIVGVGAMLYNLQAAVSNFEYVLSFGSIVFVVIVPILTMRVIAEERRQKTDQLLYALPITTTQVVLGKFAALLVVYLIPLAVISCYPVILFNYYSVSLSEYVSSTAFGSMVAIIVLIVVLYFVIRYLTKNEVLAYGVCFVLAAVVCVVGWTDASKFEGLLPDIMRALSLFDRFSAFVSGVFDLTAIVYYLSVAAFFLFLSVQSLEKRRYN